MSTLEQAAQNLIGSSVWQHPTFGTIHTPFPWECRTEYNHVTILAADGQVLISDDTQECDPVFWAAFITALNALAKEIQR